MGHSLLQKTLRSSYGMQGWCIPLHQSATPRVMGRGERLFRTVKPDCIRKQSFLSTDDARRQISEYIRYYNQKRLHSAIGYVTPFDKLIGRDREIIPVREQKLVRAWELRVQYNTNSSLTQDSVYSDSR